MAAPEKPADRPYLRAIIEALKDAGLEIVGFSEIGREVPAGVGDIAGGARSIAFMLRKGAEAKAD